MCKYMNVHETTKPKKGENKKQFTLNTDLRKFENHVCKSVSLTLLS